MVWFHIYADLSSSWMYWVSSILCQHFKLYLVGHSIMDTHVVITMINFYRISKKSCQNFHAQDFFDMQYSRTCISSESEISYWSPRSLGPSCQHYCCIQMGKISWTCSVKTVHTIIPISVIQNIASLYMQILMLPLFR